MILHNNIKRPAVVLLWVIGALLFAPLTVSATDVYPGDPNWVFNNMGSNGTAVISAANPRSGNASLALTTSGSPNDWAFYSTYAGGGSVWNGTSIFGSLSNIDQISFDWYRDDLTVNGQYDYSTYNEDYLGGPWRAQTPVLRLLIEDDGVISELVWEKWYTNSNPARTDTWVSQNLIDQNFWQHIISPYDAYTLAGNTLSNWALSYDNNAMVYGLSVGVGSAWYDKYSGDVDNVLLSFNNFPQPAVDANFELPIPEPSACWLLASGLSFLAAALWWWRKKKQCGETQK